MSVVVPEIDVARFHEQGFTVVPRLLDSEMCEELTRRLEARSGRMREELERAAARGAGRRGLTGWTVPDGVTRYEEFWPIIFEPKLVGTVRRLLGPEARFLQHTDLHVGFSSFNWHRDSVARRYGVGDDWDDEEVPYRIVRVGIYLQRAEGSTFRLGLVPGTHRHPRPDEVRTRRRIERSAGTGGHLRRVLTGRNPEPPTARWVAASGGDAVIFDPRVLHTGTPVDGPKFSIFVAFGVPNRHYVHHWYYYRHMRPDLGYRDVPSDLAERLEAAGLRHDPEAPARPPTGATVPGSRINALARRLRFS